MKKLLSLILVVVMMTTMTVPCFAAEGNGEEIAPYATAMRTNVPDGFGNYYRITGTSTISGYTGIVKTTYYATDLKGGTVQNLSGIKMTVAASAIVYFPGLSEPDPNYLKASQWFVGERGNTVSGAYSYDVLIQSIIATHTFSINDEVKCSFTSSALASSV